MACSASPSQQLACSAEKPCPSNSECLRGHGLEITFDDRSHWRCNRCLNWRLGEVWRCSTCRYNVCILCLQAPCKQVEFNSAVFDAAAMDDPSELRQALMTHAELIDAPNPNDLIRTPLHHAAACNRANAVDALVQAGSTAIDTPDQHGRTPMHAAASRGHTEVVELLARLGSKAIGIGDSDGWTPLHAAASNGQVSVVEVLVRLGSNAIDTPDKDGRTPLHAAASTGCISVIEALVRLGSKAIDTPDKHGWTPMHAAAMNGHVSMIETLVRLGSKAIDTLDNNNGWTPLFAAAWKGHAPVIETLVRLGSKAIDIPDDKGCTPLIAAASNGHAPAIETLFRLGSKAIDTPNDIGCTPLNAAAMHGHASVIEALVRLGSKAIDTPNNNGDTPLYAALDNGHVSVIETLAQLGSKAIDTPNNGGYTPLYVAASNGHVSAIETLVRLGSTAIDTPSRVLYGDTPLHMAVRTNRSSLIETLIRLGSRAIDTPNISSLTPLLTAATNQSVSTVRVLKALGARRDVGTHVLQPPMLALLQEPELDEAFVAELRFRVYFLTSLTFRLLFKANPSASSSSSSHSIAGLVAASTGPLQVTVAVISGHNIRSIGPDRPSPYVKLAIGGTKFKSSCKKKDANPLWHEEFVGRLNSNEEKVLRIRVLGRRFLAKDDLLGHAVVSLSDHYLDNPVVRRHALIDGEGGQLLLRILVTDAES